MSVAKLDLAIAVLACLALAQEHVTFGFIIFSDLNTHIGDLFKEHLR